MHPVAEQELITHIQDSPVKRTDYELSIVMPCLNEADTVGTCVRKAHAAIEKMGIRGEIIIADNGSTDGSQAIAQEHGARIVAVSAKGYGNALMGGINAAHGKYIIMGDADDSYDFGESDKFVKQLRAGYELVQGCRFPRGGGTIKKGAMPFLHYWLGNPLFSFLSRLWFKAPINDIYCGLRGFTKDLYKRLDLRSYGMEFATEMVIKASLFNAKIAEVPITLHPDGRKAHPPHLKTWRDGWRTLRFFLLYSPRWLFLIPGLFLIFLGILGYALALPAVKLGGITFDAHSLLFSSLFLMVGYQAVLFALFTKRFAISEGMIPPDPRLTRFFQWATLERGLIVGILAGLTGLVLLIGAINQWWEAGFGVLDYAVTMRWVIPGATLCMLGFQTLFGSFFISVLGMRRS
ncbi:MAG: glycosyltransferase family 2 protein [Planctomycetia bacterium]|nr:glycosyltransferase family 2 protein [Planctomycetia bacterium]